MQLFPLKPCIVGTLEMKLFWGNVNFCCGLTLEYFCEKLCMCWLMRQNVDWALVGAIISVLVERPESCFCAVFSRGGFEMPNFANFE